MMYVVCFYWHGERWIKPGTRPEEATKDGSFRRLLNKVGTVDHIMASRYVNNLYQGVRTNSVEPFRFVCFTNEHLEIDSGIEIRPFPMVTGKGVLPRMHMFSKEAGLFGHQVLSLDIDLIITGSLKKIMGYKGLFCTRVAFAPGEEGQLDGDIISFKAGPETEKIFWKPFIKDVKKAEELTQGRERLWVRHVASDIADVWQKICPGQVLSYKRHVMRGSRLPRNARIVSCHGSPRPHMITQKFLSKYWSNG